MPPYKPSFPRAASNGAKEGLEKKMNYWQDKDYQYQFAVTLGQAWNLAVEIFTKIKGTANNTAEIPTREQVLEVFDKLLHSKLDQEFIEAFDEYYANSKKSFKETTSDGLPIVRVG